MKWKKRLGHKRFTVKRLTSFFPIAAKSVIFKEQNVTNFREI
jgi:hypothetical protein